MRNGNLGKVTRIDHPVENSIYVARGRVSLEWHEEFMDDAIHSWTLP